MFHSHLIGFILRWPIFFLGMYAGHCIVTQNYTCFDKVSPRVLLFLLFIGFIFLFIVMRLLPGSYVPLSVMWQKGAWYYPGLIILYPFCYFAARLCDWCKDFVVGKKILTAFTFLGKSSWEIYIVHVVALNITKDRLTAYRQFHPELFALHID